MIPKFRAWDNADEAMVNDVYFVWQDCGYESLNECLADERFSFMQSTGLFDKNGVEIFEGDVVQSTWVDLQGKLYSKIGVVTYRDGYYSIKYPDDVEKYWWQALGAAIDPLILGNIHQHPELLEELT